MTATHHRAPWTAEQVAAIQAWQDCGWVHEMTCPNGCGVPLEATPEQLVCPACGYWQKWVPAVVLGPLPPDPQTMFDP
jgi:hypothetical protein